MEIVVLYFVKKNHASQSDRHTAMFQLSKGQYHCDGCGICRQVPNSELCFCPKILTAMLKILKHLLFIFFFRTGGADNFFHCDKCGNFLRGIISANTLFILLPVSPQGFHQLPCFPCCNLTGCCYSNVLKDSHRCVERAMHHNCPVCFEVSGLCVHSMILRKKIILNSAVRDLEKISSYLPSQYLFDSTKDISVLQCGHTIHLECMNEMRAHHQ
jgi:RING finger and CHY zinc finger domain-containing protein 1